MSTRRQYRLSAAQLAGLLAACEPVTYMVFGGREPVSPRERAEAVWRSLGEEMGFAWDTAEPSGGDQRSFTAVPLVRGHLGDPCRHCGGAHDAVQPGPCPGGAL